MLSEIEAQLYETINKLSLLLNLCDEDMGMIDQSVRVNTNLMSET